MDPKTSIDFNQEEFLAHHAFLAPAFAHDSANFLTVMQGLNSILKIALDDGCEQDVKRYAALLDDQINLLSNFFRSFIGRESDRRRESVAVLVNDYVNMFRSCSKNADIQFKLKNIDLLDAVQMPKLDFSRVIVNLLLNAVAASSVLQPGKSIIEITGGQGTRRTLKIVNAMGCQPEGSQKRESYGLQLIASCCATLDIELNGYAEGDRYISTLVFPSS